jgi:hypothetical protein
MANVRRSYHHTSGADAARGDVYALRGSKMSGSRPAAAIGGGGPAGLQAIKRAWSTQLDQVIKWLISAMWKTVKEGGPPSKEPPSWRPGRHRGPGRIPFADLSAGSSAQAPQLLAGFDAYGCEHQQARHFSQQHNRNEKLVIILHGISLQRLNRGSFRSAG